MIDETMLDRRLTAIEARLWTLEGTIQHVIAEVNKKATGSLVGDELNEVNRGVGALEAEVENFRTDIEHAVKATAMTVTNKVMDAVEVLVKKQQDRPQVKHHRVVRDANHRIVQVITEITEQETKP